jgi:hypothetical protein
MDPPQGYDLSGEARNAQQQSVVKRAVTWRSCRGWITALIGSKTSRPKLIACDFAMYRGGIWSRTSFALSNSCAALPPLRQDRSELLSHDLSRHQPHGPSNVCQHALVAASALELPLHVIQPAAQPLDGTRDIPDVIAGDGAFLIGGHAWRAGFAPHVWTIGRAIPLVAKAEGVV